MFNLNYERKNECQYLKNSDQFAFNFNLLRSKFKVPKLNAVRELRLLLTFNAQAWLLLLDFDCLLLVFASDLSTDSL